MRLRTRFRLTPLLITASASIAALGSESDAQEPAEPLIADFSSGWAERWMHIKLDSRENSFTAVLEDGDPVLQVQSDRSASGFWHAFNIEPVEDGTIAWRWKIERSIPGNRNEREKKGDDYAARLFVIFNDEPFSDGSRALCYVWAAREPVGSALVNPYVTNVMQIVLESGDARAGEWVTEERDFLKDYIEAFGERPKKVSAVAVMVDTDDTGTTTKTWFGEIRLY